MRRLCIVLLVLCIGFVIAPSASHAGAQAVLQQLRLREDNDGLDFWRPPDLRPDEQYTQGATLDAVVNRAGCVGCTQLRFEVAQRIYTPPWPSFGPERPYAGVLDAEAERRSITPRGLFAASVLAGVTGPMSGGQGAQDWFHSRFHFPLSNGWLYQTSNEPLLNLGARAEWLLTPVDWSGLTVTGGGGVAAGNLLTSATIASEARLGFHVPRPWMPESAPTRWRAYAIGGGQVDGVARTLVIDGNNQWTSGRVSRKPIVAQTGWGAGFGRGAYTLEYRGTSRGVEYRGGRWHEWASISLVYGQP